MLLESLVSSVRRVLCCQGNPDYDDDGLGDDDDDHHHHHDHCAIFIFCHVAHHMCCSGTRWTSTVIGLATSVTSP